MDYAKKILEDEKQSLIKALDGWKSKGYEEPFKIREKRLKSINKVLQLIADKIELKLF